MKHTVTSEKDIGMRWRKVSPSASWVTAEVSLARVNRFATRSVQCWTLKYDSGIDLLVGESRFVSLYQLCEAMRGTTLLMKIYECCNFTN